MKDLIEALTIFAKYQRETRWPTVCSHDLMSIVGVTLDEVTTGWSVYSCRVFGRRAGKLAAGYAALREALIAVPGVVNPASDRFVVSMSELLEMGGAL